MTKTEEAKSVIILSFIVFFIDNYVDEKTKGSVIRVKQAILSKIKNKKYNTYIMLSNDVFSNLVKEYEGRDIEVYAWDLIDMIYSSEHKVINKFLGYDFYTILGTMIYKITPDVYDTEVLKTSRAVTKSLIDTTRKIIFDKGQR